MQQFHRLEDAYPFWRAQARTLARTESGEAGRLPFQRIATSCLDWLAAQECWPNQAADMPAIAAEIEAALRRLATPLPQLVPATGGLETRPAAWALPAAIGSGIGALLASPLTFLWFDNRLIGLFGGGVLGAYLVVRGIAALLDRPRLMALIRSAAPLSGGGMVIGGVLRAIRGQSLGLVRGGLFLAAAPLVLSVLQPRPAQASPHQAAPRDDGARREVEFAQAADIALAVAWSHPDRFPPLIDRPRTEPDTLPRPVIVALSQLQGDLTGGGSNEDIRESCDELMQRLQEGGYEWQSVPRGTAYEPDMAALFDVFGTVQPGQAVRTQRAAVTRHGQVMHRGELRRV
ncbi:hypothetical protein [Rhodopila globiformis]|uniref:Uncharacterized protein n=1 Tax=Rhodopila globiformis TaxID=1071 RepID=A0A2S6NLL9_RHOGL|nr:hypothetical protein [Rhodopila globiformis]PPQ36231.1 hypothetical protein CCS01_05415 [Rhodopila globiformis]